jgi:hypothetical protein
MKFKSLPEASACQYLKLGDTIISERVMIDGKEKKQILIEYKVSSPPRFLKFSSNWIVPVVCNDVPKGIKLEYHWETQLSERLYIHERNFSKYRIPLEAIVLYEKEKKGPWHRLKLKPKGPTLAERMAAKKRKKGLD